MITAQTHSKAGADEGGDLSKRLQSGDIDVRYIGEYEGYTSGGSRHLSLGEEGTDETPRMMDKDWYLLISIYIVICKYETVC